MVYEAFFLTAAGLLSIGTAEEVIQSVGKTPTYTVRLNVDEPEHVRFEMQVSSGEHIFASPPNSGPMRTPPACGDVPLTSIADRKWIKPSGCEVVSWSSGIAGLDGKAFDASSPSSFWSARRQTWLLSGDLPWLRYDGQSWASVHVSADMGRGFLASDSSLPGTADSPTYILIGQAKRSYNIGSVITTIYGDIPVRPQSDRLQRVVATTLARWQRDLLPDDAPKRKHFNYMWFAEAMEQSRAFSHLPVLTPF